MTNRELIQEYISKRKKYNACNHLGYSKNTLWNYSTVICELFPDYTAKVNIRKYSRTTSKIQSMLKHELKLAGYTVSEYDGEPCNYWNYGYMGAECWKVSDFATC